MPNHNKATLDIILIITQIKLNPDNLCSAPTENICLVEDACWEVAFQQREKIQVTAKWSKSGNASHHII